MRIEDLLTPQGTLVDIVAMAIKAAFAPGDKLLLEELPAEDFKALRDAAKAAIRAVRYFDTRSHSQ